MLKVLLLFYLVAYAKGHGYMSDPPNRSSLWRYKDYDPYISPYKDKVVENYNDNENYCGGFAAQVSHGYKCGICGDEYTDLQPRKNEGGGLYGKGIIVRQYMPESIIQVTIKITAHHKGYFEFRLCPWDNPLFPAPEECFNQYLLTNVDPDQQEDNTKWYLPNSDATSNWDYPVHLQLPPGVTCDQCVLQWRYHTGNSNGCEYVDGVKKCCIGCGEQEEFYSCSDIAIGTALIKPPPGTGDLPVETTKKGEAVKTTTTTTTTTTPSVTKETNRPYPVTTESFNGDGEGDCKIADPNIHYHQETCGSYYQCVDGKKYVFQCPTGTVFNFDMQYCDHPYNVPPPCGTKS